MTFPLKKDDPERLTTADLAKANQPTETPQSEVGEGRPKPVVSDDSRPRTAPTDVAAIDAARSTTTRRSAPAPVEATPLFPDEQLRDLQARWDDIQTGFVDEPRSAVERADSLVAHAMQQLAEAFSRERANLEHQWDSGQNISTEDLRVAFQRYRSFFRRLLSM
jgi:mRNA-degrading endonuclease toxin of MazEF toxin-antitoxin module